MPLRCAHDTRVHPLHLGRNSGPREPVVDDPHTGGSHTTPKLTVAKNGAHRAGDARRIPLSHQASTLGRDYLTQGDIRTDDNRTADRHGLRYRDPEAFVGRRQHKHVRALEQGAFLLAYHCTQEHNPPSEADLLDPRSEPPSNTFVVRAGYEQTGVWKGNRSLTKRFHEEIEPLLLGDAAEERDDASGAVDASLREERLGRGGPPEVFCIDSDRYDPRCPLVTEGSDRAFFMLRRAHDRSCPVDVAILDETMVEVLGAAPPLSMPWIQAAMGLDDVRNPSMSSSKHRSDGVEPVQAVDVNDVVLG